MMREPARLLKHAVLSVVPIRDAHLHVGVKGGLAQGLPVRARLKAQLVHAGGEHVPADESRAAAIFIGCPKDH